MKKLKNGEIDKVYLCSKYVLKIENNNLYISRGGKKKYFLNNEFIYRYLLKDTTIQEEENNIHLQDIKNHLEKLLDNKKLGNNTKEVLYIIQDLIDQII